MVSIDGTTPIGGDPRGPTTDGAVSIFVTTVDAAPAIPTALLQLVIFIVVDDVVVVIIIHLHNIPVFGADGGPGDGEA